MREASCCSVEVIKGAAGARRFSPCFADLTTNGAALTAYAHARSDSCPFMENKTFCSNCRVHCYSGDMRERIRRVMCYSGPRMLRTHPILAVRHLPESSLERRG